MNQSKARLNKCFNFGIVGNLFFILFSIICFAYYQAFGHIGDLPIVDTAFQIVAYTAEAAGFIFMLFAMIWFAKTVRQRILMKLMFCVYILTELILMLLEWNSYREFVDKFYDPYGLPLAIGHAIFTALVCFTFLSLDPHKFQLECVIIVTVAIVLVGMFGNIMGYRIYFSILTNAIAFCTMFGMLKFFTNQEAVEIDCFGDKARVIEYKSEFFD